MVRPDTTSAVANEDEARKEMCKIAPTSCHLRLDNTSVAMEWPTWVQGLLSYRAFDGKGKSVCRHCRLDRFD